MSSAAGKSKTLRRADASTIQDKFLVGYQGWFTCPGDGEPIAPGHHGWLHWFNHPITSGGRPNTDLWPDVSEYTSSELFPAPGLNFENGDQSFLFSSRHPQTVQRHFHWMALHSVDGAFLQRFAMQIDVEGGNEGMRHLRDEVGDRVREAAEIEGRVFAIMYDVTGVSPDRIQTVLERDWIHLVRVKGILDSPSYLKEKGKPVIALWGFGFENSHHSPSTVAAIATFFRNNTPGGAYVIAGTPAHWRTSSNDADRNPEFVDVWLNEFDAISPWTVGRYGNEDDADVFAEEKLKGDVELLKKRNEEGSGRKVDYIPVVFPGGSGFNSSEGKWVYNDIKRNGGKFLWKQIFNARRQGVRVMYGAMWDEYDEGTALMPVVEKKRHLPKSDKWSFMALDVDGYDLPPDWYMRICGFAVEGLRSERRIHESFPGKELQDYWSNRPRYEELDEDPGINDTGSGSGAGEDAGRSYQEWLASQKEDKDELAPPPYSLEAEEAQEAAAPQTPVLASTPASAPASAATSSSPGPPPIDTSSRPQIYRTSSVTSPSTAYPSQSAGQPTTSLSDNVGRPTEPGTTSGYSSQAVGQPNTATPPSTDSFSRPPETGPVSAYPSPSSASISPLADSFGRPGVSSPQPEPTSGYSPQAVGQPTTSISSLTDSFGRPGVSSPRPGPTSGYSPQAVGQPTTSISSLTDSFGRHGMSSPEPGPGSSPPPLPITQRPYSTPSPSSSSNVPSGGQPAAFQHSPTPPLGSQGQWSQTQWPPPEWKTQQPHHHFTRPPQHPHSGRIQTSPSPGLSRPHSSSVSHLAGLPAPQARPPTGVPSGEASFMQPLAQQPQQTPPNAYPGQYPPQHIAHPISPYPPMRTSSFPSGPSQVPHGPETPEGFSAGSSPPMPSAYGQVNPYGPSQNPMPVGGPQFPSSNSQQSGYFDGHNRPGYYRPSHTTQPYPQQQSTFQGYPGEHSPYQPGQPMPSGPGPTFPGPATGFPTPQTSGGHYGGPPPPPQHIANYSPYPPSGPSFPSASAPPSSGPLGFAMIAADSLGLGDSTKKQIERVAQSGNKLLNKFL